MSQPIPVVGRYGCTPVRPFHAYDAVGNRTYKENLTSGFSSHSEVYQYDSLHRLRTFKRGTLNTAKTDVATAVAPPFNYLQEWVEFDLLGNWLSSRTRLATTPPTTTTDARTLNNVNEYLTRQLTGQSSVNLTTDAAGNLTDTPDPDGTGPEAAWEYTYDAENRLTTVTRKGSPNETVQVYAYDALGRRVKTVDSCPSSCSGGCAGSFPGASSFAAGTTRETWHIYAGTPACVEEYLFESSSATLLRYFVHGTNFPDPLALVDRTSAGASGSTTSEVLWYLKDALGSVIALRDASEAVVERYVYDPYGKTIITSASGTAYSVSGDCLAAEPVSAYGNPFAWTGQRYDARVGLHHFFFRSYSAVLGRWLQRDPMIYADSMNLYEAMLSAPCLFLDAFGLQTPGPQNDPVGDKGNIDHPKYRNPPGFKDWFHRHWKKKHIEGNRDATQAELDEAFDDFKEEVRDRRLPRKGEKWRVIVIDPSPKPRPAPKPPTWPEWWDANKGWIKPVGVLVVGGAIILIAPTVAPWILRPALSCL